MKNDNKKSMILWLVGAFLSYIAAILFFVGNNHAGIGALWLCIGSLDLINAIIVANKAKTKDDKEKKKNGK